MLLNSQMPVSLLVAQTLVSTDSSEVWESSEFQAALLGALVGGLLTVLAQLIGNRHASKQLRREQLAKHVNLFVEGLFECDYWEMAWGALSGVDRRSFMGASQMSPWLQKRDSFDKAINRSLEILQSGWVPKGVSLGERGTQDEYSAQRRDSLLMFAQTLSNVLSTLPMRPEGEVIKALRATNESAVEHISGLAQGHGRIDSQGTVL